MPLLVGCVGLAAIEVIFVGGVDDGSDARFFVGKGAKLRHGGYRFIVMLGGNHRFRTAQGSVDALTLGRDRALQSQTLVEMGIDFQSVVVQLAGIGEMDISGWCGRPALACRLAVRRGLCRQ